ncbi:MAG: hypothetical protein Q7S86_03600 [bacterium]|nr:hypothetical protein [bacterium]
MNTKLKRPKRWFAPIGFFLALFIAVFFMANTLMAADGSGTNTVSPTSTTTSSVGNTFNFTFTAAETMDSGEINLLTPTGWSAMQGVGGTAGYTTVTSTGMIANVLDNADSITGWSAGTQCSSGLTSDTTNKQEGAASIACSSGNVNAGAIFYKNITSEDWSGYTKVGFWIRSGKALAAGDLQFSYDDSSNLGSPIENISVPAIPFNSPWTYVVLDLGATTRTSVISFGFRNNTGGGPLDFTVFRIDDILIGPGSPSFPGGGVVGARLLQLSDTQTVTITYGSGGGGSGVTAPGVAGMSFATTTNRVSDAGTLMNIGTQPTLTATEPASTTTTPTAPTIGRYEYIYSKTFSGDASLR